VPLLHTFSHIDTPLISPHYSVFAIASSLLAATHTLAFIIATLILHYFVGHCCHYYYAYHSFLHYMRILLFFVSFLSLRIIAILRHCYTLLVFDTPFSHSRHTTCLGHWYFIVAFADIVIEYCHYWLFSLITLLLYHCNTFLHTLAPWLIAITIISWLLMTAPLLIIYAASTCRLFWLWYARYITPSMNAMLPCWLRRPIGRRTFSLFISAVWCRLIIFHIFTLLMPMRLIDYAFAFIAAIDYAFPLHSHILLLSIIDCHYIRCHCWFSLRHWYIRSLIADNSRFITHCH